MIEEEDDEAILNKGIKLKSVLKTLFVILLIVLGALTIYIGIIPGDQLLNFFIGFILICVGTTIIQYPSEPSEPIKQTLTILTCSICGITKVRNFIQGDFVYKQLENCEKCNGLMQINQIYSVKFKKQTKKEKKQELLTEKSSKK